MVVYVEWVLLDNFLMDYVILYGAAVTLRFRCPWWRIALGSAVGAVGAAISVFVYGIFVYVYKISLLFAMSLCVCGRGKKLFWYILLTAAYTFTLGGIVIGVFNLLHVDYLTSDGLMYTLNVPVGVYVAAVALFAVLVYSLYKYIVDVKRVSAHVVGAAVTMGSVIARVRAFRDSGNTVTYDGKAVCFVTGRIKGFADYYAACLLRGQTVSVQVCTVCGQQQIAAVTALLQVDGEAERQVYLALPQSKCPALYELIIDV